MKAEEMFEKLGLFKIDKPPFKSWLVYAGANFPLSEKVIFDLKFRNVTLDTTITPKLYKAIGQQMKELGWFNE